MSEAAELALVLPGVSAMDILRQSRDGLDWQVWWALARATVTHLEAIRESRKG